MRRARVRKLMERAALGRLSSRGWERLRAQLLANDGLRREYDAMTNALRCLENRAIHQQEHALVEALLLGPDVSQPASQRPGVSVGVGVAVAAAAIAAVVLAVVFVPSPTSLTGGDDGFTARGGPLAPALGLMLVCGDQDASVASLSDAALDGCALDDVMTFAYRLPQGAAIERGYLSAFGLTDDGRLLYYAPTPTEPRPVAVDATAFAATEVSVRLSVNHDVGTVHVFAIVSPEPLPLESIEVAAAALSRSQVDLDTSDWTQALPFPTRALLCSDRSCFTARFDLEIHP